MKALYFPDVPFETLYIPQILDEIYMHGVYTEAVKSRQDMVIVDIGANIGVVTMYLREHARKVYAIEPSVESFEALRQSKEHNHWDNVELFNLAIADTNGQADLFLHEENHTGNTLMVNGPFQDGSLVNDQFYVPTVYKEHYPVPAMTLDTFFQDNGIDHVDLVKMDIEGMEDKVIRSESFAKVAPMIDMIEIEFHYPNWMELATILCGMGYKARRYVCDATIVLFHRGEM